MYNRQMKAAEKVLRWRSRRGMLELDLLLDTFWRRAAEQGGLSEAELQGMDALLALEDDALWRRIVGGDDSDFGGSPINSAAETMIRRLRSL